MNILAVTPFPPQKSGGATSVYEFFIRLTTQGYNFKVISYLTSIKYSSNLESVGLDLGKETSFKRGVKFIFNSIRVGRKLNKKIHFDLIYGKNITSPSFAAYFLSLLTRKPLVVHTSGADIQELDPNQERQIFSKGFLFFLTKFLRRRVLSRASIVIANNKIDFQVLRDIGFKEKTILLRNGVDKEKFSPGVKEVKDYPTLIFVGRAEIEKNPDHLLEIASELKNPLLLIGGSHEEFSRFGEISKNVEVIGITNEIETLYKKADIFIQTSSSEGLSNALLEAMASGNVPITYPSGDAIYIIENGINGFICNSKEEIIDKVKYLTENKNKLQEMGENALKTIHEQFDWSKSVKEMDNILKNFKEIEKEKI